LEKGKRETEEMVTEISTINRNIYYGSVHKINNGRNVIV
jgi:hypothetical protein